MSLARSQAVREAIAGQRIRATSLSVIRCGSKFCGHLRRSSPPDSCRKKAGTLARTAFDLRPPADALPAPCRSLSGRAAWSGRRRREPVAADALEDRHLGCARAIGGSSARLLRMGADLASCRRRPDPRRAAASAPGARTGTTRVRRQRVCRCQRPTVHVTAPLCTCSS
jgi:hypothetical protein